MGCYFEENRDGETIRACISLSRKELLYDIENIAYIEGSALETEATPHNRHLIQDIGQEGNVDRVTRVLNREMATVREILYSYTKREIETAEMDNRLREPQTYGLVMELPKSFSQTTLRKLEELIHEYLVCRAVADWFGMTNPGKAPLWEEKAEQTKTEIKSSMNSRLTRERRRLHPF